MGYSERICQLCGIPFNIGRIRRPGNTTTHDYGVSVVTADGLRTDEPESAAWSNIGGTILFISDEEASEECSGMGCSSVARDQGDETEEEHLAGSNCVSEQGYSGWRISVEDMKDIIRMQCLAVKEDDWRLADDDEDSELEAKECFLTGISSEPPDEFDVDGLTPVRHDVSETMINNVDEGDGWAIPFHPTCFEIFKRISRKRLGTIDIDGLWELRRAQGEYSNRFARFPDRFDRDACCQQWFRCVPGTEYLVANPLTIPGLEDLIQSCSLPDGSSADVVFDTKCVGPAKDDIFAQLSPELRLMILEFLKSEEVAKLRLASRTFFQLPQSIFHHLVLSEMPWVWEINDLKGHEMDWYGLWCKLSQADGGAGTDEKRREWMCRALNDRYGRLRERLQAEGEEWMQPDVWKAESAGLSEEAEAEVEKGLREGKFNVVEKPELKGLRNRRRIWRDVEKICRRIRKLEEDVE